MVVFSACQTWGGDLKQAEGTMGLRRAFLARGARGVMVSLWSVNDASTELTMKAVYRNWLGGQTRAEALRLAQLEVARTFPHPRFWATSQWSGAPRLGYRLVASPSVSVI